jgi:hypothetical protein
MCTAGVGSVMTGTTAPDWVGPYLDAQLNANELTQMCLIAEDVTASSGDLWVRFYAESEADPTGQIEIMQLSSNAPMLGLGISNMSNTIVWTGFGVAPVLAIPPAVFMPGQWTCIEAHVAFGAGGSFTVYVDGQLASTSDASVSGPFAPISQLLLGIVAANDSGAYDFHFDDLAIGTTSQRIGCE